MGAQMIDFYRKTCFTGRGDPTKVEWTSGSTPDLTITPASGKVVRVTGLLFLTQTMFDIDTVSGDVFRIAPWGYGSPAQVDISSFRSLAGYCKIITPMILGVSANNYHHMFLPFEPFIEVSDALSTEFSFVNTGGTTATLTGSVPLQIVAYSYDVDQADA